MNSESDLSPQVRNAKWLTSLPEVAQADEASLRRSLLTADGRGVELKQACLDELIKRACKNLLDMQGNDGLLPRNHVRYVL